MRRAFVVVMVVLSLASLPAAGMPATPLATLHAVHVLTNTEADKGLPVAFEATVGYSRWYDNGFFANDAGEGLYVLMSPAASFTPGDHVFIRGTTHGSFRPLVNASSVTLLRHGSPPVPVDATYDELIRAQYDALRVKMTATVRAADTVVSRSGSVRSTRLQLVTPEGHLEADVDVDNPNLMKTLLDARVEITGVSAGKFDDKMEQTGIVLYVAQFQDIKIVEEAPLDVWSYPVTPMDQVLYVPHISGLTPRVRIHGTITYYQPGSTVVLQDGVRSVRVSTHDREPLRIGDLADATGFPDVHDRELTLSDGEFRDSLISKPIPPHVTTAKELAFWSPNQPGGQEDNLVSVEGQVVTESRAATQDEYVLKSDGRLFTAIYHHPLAGEDVPGMLNVPTGATIRVTGISTILDTNAVEPGQETSFNILLRSFDDITVVAAPSLLSVRNLILLIALLMVSVLVIVTRSWLMEQNLRKQAAVLTAQIEAESIFERNRSTILEGINSCQPLANVLQQITEMVSLRFQGAPCWCKTIDRIEAGTEPLNKEGARIVRQTIPSHSGSMLGELSVRIGPDPSWIESETLAKAAELATLAIETNRIYSDLTYRSDYDQLTGLQNRASVDRVLDSMVEAAPKSGKRFGLVYTDLNDFKQVNDTYGHNAGDQYLQHAAARMKSKMRAGVTIARMGGDEFAVVVPNVEGSEELETIVRRLTSCFDDPFVLFGHTIHGSASFGFATYPEDGSTRDAMLSAADAAMYVQKHMRKDNLHTVGRSS